MECANALEKQALLGLVDITAALLVGSQLSLKAVVDASHRSSLRYG